MNSSSGGRLDFCGCLILLKYVLQDQFDFFYVYFSSLDITSIHPTTSNKIIHNAAWI